MWVVSKIVVEITAGDDQVWFDYSQFCVIIVQYTSCKKERDMLWFGKNKRRKLSYEMGGAGDPLLGLLAYFQGKVLVNPATDNATVELDLDDHARITSVRGQMPIVPTKEMIAQANQISAPLAGQGIATLTMNFRQGKASTDIKYKNS